MRVADQLKAARRRTGNRMGHGVFDTLQAAYIDYWNQTFSSQTLFGICYFVGGLAVFFIVSEARGRNLANLSLRRICHYVFPRSQHFHPSSRIDRWNWVLMLLWLPVIKAISTAAALGVGVDFHDVLVKTFGGREPLLHDHWANSAAQATALYLTAQFVLYWQHRAVHEIPFLWSFHR